MVREEMLRRNPRMYVLDRLTGDLSRRVEANEADGVTTQIILVTYNRVGEGLLGPRTIKGSLTLDTYTGLTMTSITPEQMMSLDTEAGNGLPTLLSPEQVADFYSLIKQDWLSRISCLDRQTWFVIYGGEGEKFQLAVDFISKLSSLAMMAGKGDLAKFYLLTCNHGLAEKVKLTEGLYDHGLLQTLVYNPGGPCGGLTDLQTIAEAVLNAVPEKE